MPLQVRVVHALGDQVIDLPDKPGNDPVTVGRIEGVDVQVPSANVSRRHCVLYVQDGQWVIVDAKSAAGTFVNGHRLTGPSVIGPGDQVTLGNDAAAPRLTIDPYGLLRATGADRQAAPPPALAGSARGAATVAPPRPTRKPPSPVVANVGTGLPPVGVARTAAPPPPPPPPVAQADDWLTAAAAATKVRASRPPRKQSAWTPGVVAGTVVGVIAIVSVAGFFFAKYKDKLSPPVEPPKRTASNASPKQFDEPPPPAVRTVPLPKKGPSPEEERDKRMAERGGDEAWAAVEDAHAGRVDPIRAIDTYLTYLHDHPKTPYAADLRKFIDEDLDRLWWKHVEELLLDRRKLGLELSGKTAELAQTQDPDFKERVEKERDEIRKDIEVIDAKLKAINYESKEPPNLDNPEMMQALRNARDEELWRNWKQRAEALIGLSHGRDPLW